MAIDPIVAEVRQAREAYAKQFNYDVYAMGRDLQERQQKSGRTVVALPPQRIESILSIFTRTRLIVASPRGRSYCAGSVP
jgi:hypothetical protein